MTKEEIIEYVMHSPANTNPAVLNSLLEQMGGGSGGGGVYELEGTLVPDPTAPIESGTIQINATYEQLLSAHNEGKVCVVNFPDEELGIELPMILIAMEYEGAIVFSGEGIVSGLYGQNTLFGEVQGAPEGIMGGYFQISMNPPSKEFIVNFDNATHEATFDTTYEELVALQEAGVKLYYRRDSISDPDRGEIKPMMSGEFRFAHGIWATYSNGKLFVNYDSSTGEYTTIDAEGFHPIVKQYNEYSER